MGLVTSARSLALVAIAVMLCALAHSAIGQPTDTGRRVALVIGMSKYKAEAELANATNDARLVAEALRRIGFDVDLVLDTGIAETRLRLRRFADKADNAAQAVVFFAGHGMQVNGVNYLLPVDAQLDRERDLPDETIDLDRIMTAVANANTRIVILDACRNNPLSRSMRPIVAGRNVVTPGLSQIQRMDAGSLIVFSTSPNTVALDGSGANSPFSTALSKHVGTPGAEIRQVISRVRADVLTATGGKQLPWDNSSLIVDVFLSGEARSPAKGDIVEAPGVRRTTEESDRLFWASIKDSDQAEEYRIYLQQFPNGTFAALARQRLTTLQNRPKPASPPTVAAKPADTRRTYDPERIPFVARPVPDFLKGLTTDTTRWALAVARNGGYAVAESIDVKDSIQAALEICEFSTRQPCFLYAVQNQVLDSAAAGAFAPQPQAALRQTGAKFDPARVPFLDTPDKRQLERAASVAGMSTGHSALAISHVGKWSFSVHADLQTAQREALAGCNKESGRPCFVFAVNGKVVMVDGGLDRQLTAVAVTTPAPPPSAKPSPPPAAPAPPPAAATVKPSTPQQYDPAQIPFVSKPVPKDLVDLATRPTPWVLVLAPDGGQFYRWGTRDSDPARAPLEACEFHHQQACFVYAISGVVAEKGAAGWTPKPQSTLRQTGQRLDTQRVPFILEEGRRRLGSLVAGVPAGHRHVTAVSVNGAWWFDSAERPDGLQQRVLASCNQSNPNKSFPCFIYQVDGTVVMRPGGIGAQIK